MKIREKFKVDESVAQEIKNGITEIHQRWDNLSNITNPDPNQLVATLVEIERLVDSNKKAAHELMKMDTNLKAEDLLAVQGTYFANASGATGTQKLVVLNFGNHYAALTKENPSDLPEDWLAVIFAKSTELEAMVTSRRD